MISCFDSLENKWNYLQATDVTSTQPGYWMFPVSEGRRRIGVT